MKRSKFVKDGGGSGLNTLKNSNSCKVLLYMWGRALKW